MDPVSLLILESTLVLALTVAIAAIDLYIVAWKLDLFRHAHVLGQKLRWWLDPPDRCPVCDAPRSPVEEILQRRGA